MKSSEQVFHALRDALNLPQQCVRVELVLEREKVAVIRCEYYPDPNLAELTTALAEFELVKRDG